MMRELRLVYEMADDLYWDFTGDSIDEETSLLIANSKSDSRCTIHRQHVQYIVKNLEDTLRILNESAREWPSVKVEEKKTWLSRFSLPEFVVKYFLVFTIILQALNIVTLSIIDASVVNKTEKVAVDVGSGVMITLEVINLILVILTSAKLTKQLVSHKVSTILLAQSYFASLLLFAGLYTLTYRLERKSWTFIGEVPHNDSDPVLLIDVYMKMLYLSVSTATLCGSSSIGPKEWYNYLCMSAQMLLSFMYFTSILSQVMASNSEVGLSDHARNTVQQSGRSDHVRYRYYSGRTSRNSLYGSTGRPTSRLSLSNTFPQDYLVPHNVDDEGVTDDSFGKDKFRTHNENSRQTRESDMLLTE